MANWISSNLKAAETILQQTTSLQSQDKPTVTDNDWTELLTSYSRGTSVNRGLKKIGNLRKDSLVSDVKKSSGNGGGHKTGSAAELQTNMMETLDAAGLENRSITILEWKFFTLGRTRGITECIICFPPIESFAANTELTRLLAAGQKKLEDRSGGSTREQVELKESVLEVLKRNTSNIRGSGNLLNKLDASRGDIFEHRMLEAEISLLTDKIGRLQDKANKREVDINTMRKELEEPTEVEIEPKRRLDQLTDHLIQKQSQVEALSSEKATLLFRIEAVTRLIEENKGMSATEASSQDLEAGEWELSGSKFKPVFRDKIRSGKKHLGWLVMQLNARFVSGTVFLRRNPTAKIWALVYLLVSKEAVAFLCASFKSNFQSKPKTEERDGWTNSEERVVLLSSTALLTFISFSPYIPKPRNLKTLSKPGSKLLLNSLMMRSKRCRAPQEKITLKVTNLEDEGKDVYEIGVHVHLEKLMLDYCRRRNLDYTTLSFIFNGTFIRPRQTPAQLMMENDDIIDTVLDQGSAGPNEGAA
ncbi:hypothetical protein Bca52824_012968 [Brassica carinata]|uniref:Rad60/SUMO-like domain-containing protein n=2 Tax=Brassica carinata TaxID=52824 RepID=A0A8X7W008_BRACI|nr:hypothetical protein Bca52824_012968 [Brassica carinata]